MLDWGVGYVPGKSEICLQAQGKVDKVLHAKLFGAFCHDGVGKQSGEVCCRVLLGDECREKRTYVIAQCFAPLVERRLDETAEKFLVATQFGRIVACEADDCAANLGRRIEDAGLHGEEVLHIVPRLQQYAQDAVSLASRSCRHALRYFLLYHARATGNEFLVVEHLEENLAGDIIGVVARKYERRSSEGALQVHLQEIVLNDAVLQFGIRATEVLHTFVVNLHNLHLPRLLHQELRHHTHARPYFQYGQVRACVYGVGNVAGYAQVGQKVLSQELFRLNGSHSPYLFVNLRCKDMKRLGIKDWGSVKFMHRIRKIVRIGLPLAFAVGILWWMYRGFRWEELQNALSHQMSWTWMLLSMPFGVLAQVLRAVRWRQVLLPTGERPRLSTCVHAVFLSYASSLVIPRVGEVLRCGVLRRYDGTNFSCCVGTVVTERVIDTILILVLSFLVFLTQIPVFLSFFRRTGVTLGGVLDSFSMTGYFVTAACGVLAVLCVVLLASRFRFLSHTRSVFSDLSEGLLSVREVKQPILFLLYSIGIWLSYYLHFYLTFFCFDFTAGLGSLAALVAFVVGTFAVLVPTPNGAGSWHFAVKTILVLYGVEQTSGALFVLIVHTLQTLLVVLLGVWSLLMLLLRKR